MRRWLSILWLAWASTALAHLPAIRPVELPLPSLPPRELVCVSWLSATVSWNHLGRYTVRTRDHPWRLQTLTNGSRVFSYGYPPASAAAQVAWLVLPNSAWITNHYDSLARLDWTALVSRWGHVLDAYAYTHDPLGLRTNVVRDLGWTANSVSAGHDAIGQLTAWTAQEADGTTRLHEQLRYGYDAAGNLRSRTNGALAQTFGNNALNQVTNVIRAGTLTVSGNTPVPATSVTVNNLPESRYGDFTFARTNVALSEGNNTFQIVATRSGATVTNSLTVTLPQTVTLLYDLNGNLTNDGLRHFRYDAKNQIATNWVTGAWKQEFVYDGFGRKRIERTYGWAGSDWNKTNETRYVYDGMLAIQERNASNQPQVTYTRGLDLSGSLQGAGGIGGLLARTDSGGSTFYRADGAGNVTSLIDERNNVVARYAYNAFGQQVGQWGPLADINRYRFSSKQVQPLSGLSYYGFRFYDPGLQRWLNQDPLGEAGGINLYQGLFNSPLNFVDRNGLDNMYAPSAGQNAPVNVILSMAARGGTVDAEYGGTDELMLMLLDFAPGGLLAQDLLLGIPNDLGQLADTTEAPIERWGAGLRLGGRAILAGVSGAQLAKPPMKPPCPTPAESGAANRAAFEAYKDSLRAQMSRPPASNPELNSLLDKLYRTDAQVGSGSTAAAVRQELVLTCNDTRYARQFGAWQEMRP